MTTEPGFNELPYFEEKLKPTALRVASEVAIAEMMSFYPGRAESPSCWSLVLPIVLLRIGSIGVLPSADVRTTLVRVARLSYGDTSTSSL